MLKHVLATIGIIVAYWVLGQLGLLLAIPPGYATAIFPPAGLALALMTLYGRRTLPAIWLGSMLLNISADKAGLAMDGISWLLAALIASGSSLQAYAGSRFLKAYRDDLSRLLDGNGLLRFTLGCGLLATLIAATVGVSSLLLLKQIGPEEYAYSWLTWWVGDAIGVLIITPIFFMLLAKPRPVWRHLLLPVSLPLVITFALAVMLFLRISEWEAERQQESFADHSQKLAAQMNASLRRIAEGLRFTERLFEASAHVSAQEFNRFANEVVKHNPVLIGLAWAPEIRPEQQAEFVQQMQATHGHPFQIRRLTPVEAERLYPVAYIEPEARHGLLGIDLFSEPVRRQTILQAIASGQLTLSPPLQRFNPEMPSTDAIWVFPVTDGNLYKRSIVAALLAPAELVEEALSETEFTQLRVTIETHSSPAKVIYQNDVEVSSNPLRLQLEFPLSAVNDAWRLRLEPSPAYLSSHSYWQSWLVLAAGMLFAALLEILLLSFASREMRTQSQVQWRTRELQQSRQQLQAIMDGVQDAVVLLDQSGQPHSMNPLARQWFAGQETLPDAFAQPIQDWHVIQRLLNKLGRVYHHQSQFRLGSGELIPIEVSGSTVQLDDQRFYSLTLHDIRHRYELERMKNEFVAMVSHELRTPLTSIRGALGLLRSEGIANQNENASKLLNMAVDNSDRLARLINDLLDLERLELGKLRFQMKTVALKSLLEAVCQQHYGFANSHDITLLARLDIGEELNVRVDSDRLSQVMANLISNAIKFSPAGSAVHVNAQFDPKTNSAEIEVIDHGIGIPADLQEKVFTKFWQADSTALRKYGGSGLGLWITKQLIEQMHGQIRFSSKENEGSRFTVVLPCTITPRGMLL
ncbi:ATP-binding protein [Permianibacter aggregans]|uniref:histidine kinase n=1 Tax=Permianibacter aggregans TaxID=1510150 RepID=A0A4R6UI41_9GAMM|nr:ATP-binding protein [Permianibacter aggregans]TDQ46471.1 PAS domain S-box-containing protein [Permianibacter aggregans]